VNNQKRIFEILIYVLLLIVGLFSYFADVDIGLYKDIKPASQEEKIFDEVPQDLIDYNFIFEGE